ncbi:MAG: hypothetical protein NVS4B7_12100 [Ktedonobacteraceae bacterium]
MHIMELRRYLVHTVVLLLSLCLLISATALKPTTTHAATHPTKGDVNILPDSKNVQPFATAPAYTTSYYESTTYYGTLQNQGCSAAHGSAGIVVLDFGEPDYSGGSYGTYDFGGHFDSDNAIFHAAANFIYGAWNCRISSTNIAVAIGTSNYYGALSATSSVWYAAGQAWGNMVNSAQSYSASNGYNNVIGAYGADDIETEWANYTLSSNFVNGYNNTSSRLFFDYGDDTPGYWTNYQVWYVAYGANDNYPLPEIYYNADATQDWEPLSEWACNSGYGAIYFKGTMSEYPSGNSPSTAWYDMYNAEGATSCTAAARSALIFSTNI